MVETVIAVLVIVFAFLALFRLSHMLTGKILLEHAAMRVARARTIGLNDFMCLKTARVSVIPVAGTRLWPAGKDEFDYAMELSRVPIYLATPDGAVANGVLDYEGWHRLEVSAGGGSSETHLGFDLFDDTMRFDLDGKAELERNYTLYMND